MTYRDKQRLIEIGEAVKSLPEELLASRGEIPWGQIARMRDHLAHRYFDTTHAVVEATVDKDIDELRAAVNGLLATLERDGLA